MGIIATYVKEETPPHANLLKDNGDKPLYSLEEFYSIFKDALHGYTSRNYGEIIEYQKHLNNIQVWVKFIRSDSKNPYNRFVSHCITDFQRFDFKDRNNFKAILQRMPDKSYLNVYNDFVLRIIGIHRELVLVCNDVYKDKGIHRNKEKFLVKRIVLGLRPFLPDITDSFVYNLIKNKPPKHPLTWIDSQYSFDYFIKGLPGIHKKTYKAALNSFFVFTHSEAYVRTGGSFKANHHNKPYVKQLGEIHSYFYDLIK